ncbi:CapA family protein [Streptomyces sp. NPDC014724]|uniref:CapA family protein n=1 Tax=unclassified Streptomyces TaxID=2593676 RepID=UPI0036FBB632
MAFTVALAGDTMLGRNVAKELRRSPVPETPVSTGVRKALAVADRFVLDLECCVSDRGHRWPDPRKAFFFRASSVAATVPAELGVNCVTLANNHALDHGFDAMADTRPLLVRAHLVPTRVRAGTLTWTPATPARRAARSGSGSVTGSPPPAPSSELPSPTGRDG